MDATPLSDRPAYLHALEQVRTAAQAYYQGDEEAVVMDDATYDQLVRDILATEQAHPDWAVTNTVTAVAGGTGTGDIAHSAPMLSLDNVFSDAELDEWAASLTRRLGHAPDGFTIEPKMDGLALAARYVDGRLSMLLQRGNGQSAEDATYAAPMVVGLPAQLPAPLTFEVRGEVLFTDAQFDAANEARLAHGDKPFANPRNGSSGALRGAKDRTYPLPMTFFAYGVVDPTGAVFGPDERHSTSMARLAELGISTTGTSKAGMGQVTSISSAHAWIDALIARRPQLGFRIDGAVIKADSPADREQAGFSSRAPRWAIARKFDPDTRITTLLGVEWQLGRTGLITPRADLEPVQVGGTTVTSATLHNPADIARRDLRIGDKVTVFRAGEVIPRVEAPVVNLRTGAEVPIVPPTVCPRCGADIDRSQERWRCTRGRLCGLEESIRYAVSRDALDVDGMGDKLVTQLVASGLVADIADLFTLTRADLLGLDRMGALSVDKLLAQLQGAKSAPLARVITALGILGTGRSMSRRLARAFGSLPALAAAGVDELVQVDGIGPEKAPVIVEELAVLAPVIAKLAAAGVTMRDEQPDATPAALPLAGKTVCVSGSVPGLSRNEANEAVEALGGKSTGSVSKNTDLLVAGDGAGSKLAKAATLGVAVMDAAEFAALVTANRR